MAHLTEREIERDAETLLEYISIENIKVEVDSWAESWEENPESDQPDRYRVLKEAIKIHERRGY